MDTGFLFTFVHEFLFLIVIFGFFFCVTFFFGRQTITNIILGLYFAFLISLQFPYYDLLLSGTDGARSEAILILAVFSIFTFCASILFARLMPHEYHEGRFESFGKKILLTAAATVLTTAFSYHALPVTEFITPGSPVTTIFGSESSFFWWLVVPIVVLFLT